MEVPRASGVFRPRRKVEQCPVLWLGQEGIEVLFKVPRGGRVLGGAVEHPGSSENFPPRVALACLGGFNGSQPRNPVAAEQRCAPYHSDEYAYPQSVEDDIIQRLGGLFSPYTNEMFDSKGDTDIEHVVARSEAHDSGLCRADAATKQRFSRDLLNLALASPSVNRYQKGAKDAAEWQPEANQCWFAQTVVAVRRAYRLTIDRREADALDGILAGCSSTENFR